jgi:hypothetical protein
VIDNAEYFLEKNFAKDFHLGCFMKIHEFIPSGNFSLILITRVVWDRFRQPSVSFDPITYLFSPYDKGLIQRTTNFSDAMVEILGNEFKRQVNSETLLLVFKEFVAQLWDLFAYVSKDLNEFRYITFGLFPYAMQNVDVQHGI